MKFSVYCVPFAGFPAIELSFDSESDMRAYAQYWWRDAVEIYFFKDDKEFLPLWWAY